MKSIRSLMGILIILMPMHFLHAQETEETEMLRYSPDFRFKDGLYLNINTLKNNDPIPLARIISESGFSNKDFINELRSSNEIVLYDDYGIRRTMMTKDIWGYAENGRLYIMLGGRFQRIMIQGSISLFTASATTQQKTRFSSGDTGNFTTTDDIYRSFYSKEYYYKDVTGERREYLFDIESNMLTGFTYEELGMLLGRDSVLSAEYASLRIREKKRRMLEFIRRYNQNHPLYFPVH